MTQHRLTPLLLAAALPLAALPATSLAAGAEDHSHHTMPMPASHGHMSAAEHEAMFGQPGEAGMGMVWWL